MMRMKKREEIKWWKMGFRDVLKLGRGIVDKKDWDIVKIEREE